MRQCILGVSCESSSILADFHLHALRGALRHVSQSLSARTKLAQQKARETNTTRVLGGGQAPEDRWSLEFSTFESLVA